MAAAIRPRAGRCRAALLVVSSALAPACAGALVPATTPGPDPAAADALSALEARLLSADPLSVRYRTTAEGAMEAGFEGELVLRGDSAWLRARGRFASEPVEPRLTVGGGRMTGGSATREFHDPAPAGVRAALVLGLTRMGLMHNLAMLALGRPPDRVDGTVAEWVRATDVEWIPLAGVEPGSASGLFRFGVMVDGRRAADAELWLGPDGWPLVRYQTVRMERGEVRVREEYVFGY